MSTTVAPAAQLTDDLQIWVGGQVYADPEQARVGALDHGMTVGNGVFETMKVTADGVFALRRHLDRLSRSAAALGLPAPDHAAIRAAIDEVLAGRTYADGKVRITYSGGLGPLGSQPAYGTPTLVVAADREAPHPTTTQVVTAPWVRNENGALTGVKSTSYGENVRALAYAAERGATEAIFANSVGHLCEGTGSNIFCVFGDTIVTPPLASGPLAGITRQLVLEWCTVEERDLTMAEAATADEVFLTSSLRDVQAVVRWDDRELAAGPVTQRAAEVFAERSAAHLEP